MFIQCLIYKITKKNKAALKFISELQKGRLSGEQKDWLSKEEVEKHFKEKLMHNTLHLLNSK